MVGRIHSFESFGTVDGPGIRFVVFLQGCPLRCLYCHNPDTWDQKQTGKYLLSPGELLEEVLRYKSFIAKGGVTVTGGEPLLQPEFLFEFFSLCKENGIHTALDTSGAVVSQEVYKVLNVTDLVLLDVKSIDADQHRKLTGAGIDNTLHCLDYLEEKNIPVWIRHVIVPGWTDDDLLLKKTADRLARCRCIEKVELLPYHTMGVRKYEQLGIEYRLANTLPLSPERLENARNIFRNAGLRVS
jgi:pyruvate formate lyase activating enzyme